MADRFANLGNFQRMSQSSTVKIILPTPKDLRFTLESTECCGVQNSVPINLERRPKIIRGIVARSTLGIKGLVKTILHARE
jgi:hypothetical protein